MLFRERTLNLLDHLARQGIPKSIRVDDFPAIDIDAELAEAPAYNFNFRLRLFPQRRCHTGSNYFLYWSNRAVVYDDSFHSFTSTSVTYRKLSYVYAAHPIKVAFVCLV